MKLSIYKQNYQIIIEYDGTDYVGWQKQKNGKSIQGEIENSFNITITNLCKGRVFARKPDQSSLGKRKKVAKKRLNLASSKLINLRKPN